MSRMPMECGDSSAALQKANQVDLGSSSAPLPKEYSVLFAANHSTNIARWMISTWMEELANGKYVRPMYFAGEYAMMGDSDQAISWLKQSYEQRDISLIYLNVQPIYDNIRTDPRFRALLRKIHLVN